MHPSVLGTVDKPHTLVLIGRNLGRIVDEASRRWPTAAIVPVDVAALAETPSDLWRTFDRPEARDITGLAVIVDPATPPTDRELTTDAIAIVKRAVAGARMNAKAREDNAGRYVVNTLRNARLISEGPDPTQLDDAFAGMPAIVVGAGPSLDRQMADLRRFKDRAVIIAADTAWRPLASAGIEPHFVVAIDPTPANGRHLRDVPSQGETWLLVEGSVDPDALAAVEQPIAAFRIGSHEPWPQLIADGYDRKFVRAWGSVLTSAFDLAIGFGCNPIVFAGADLAFTDGRPYCRLTTFEDDWGEHTERGATLETVWRNTIGARDHIQCDNLTGGQVESAPHLIEFRNWIVKRAAEAHDRRIINTTGAGILTGPAIEQDQLPRTFEDCPPIDRCVRDITARSLVTEAATGRDIAHARPRSTEVKCASFNLSTTGLRAGWSIAPAGDRARFVPRAATASIDIAADGSLHTGLTWPIPIMRELPLSTGGALAWNRDTSTVAWRDDTGSDAMLTTLPFRASQAIELDGDLYWYAFGGGIWQWHPVRGGERIMATPEATGFHIDGADLWLAPLSRDAEGRAMSTPHPYAWRVDIRARCLQKVAVGNLGASVAAARQGHWIARAFPSADRIELTHDEGWRLAFPSPCPIGLSWAGESLVVVSGSGEVRILDGLRPILS